mmetsp:Transcript_63934/g.138985  ORF Transcript_63934/g.138985 Transcript_63934/m.138985 type:complete len:92 (-) Transcript_63934:128-403(-)
MLPNRDGHNIPRARVAQGRREEHLRRQFWKTSAKDIERKTSTGGKVRGVEDGSRFSTPEGAVGRNYHRAALNCDVGAGAQELQKMADLSLN